MALVRGKQRRVLRTMTPEMRDSFGISNMRGSCRTDPHGITGLLTAICVGTSVLLSLASSTPAAVGESRAGASQPSASRPPGNLVVNGSFETGETLGELPAGWTTKHPGNVKRVHVGGGRGWVIEMTGDKELMGTYGTDLLSSKIPIKANTQYRCTGYTRSSGPRMIVFVKGYATLTHQVMGRAQTGEEAVYQVRKEIPPSADWQPFNLDFQIKPTSEFSPFQHRIEYVRITLWAYWPEGTCWYDDVRFEMVGPVEADQLLREEPFTHVGVKPRLGQTQPAASQPSALDEDQAWQDAQNAWQEDRHADALRLAEQLIARTPDRPDYHVLAARAAAGLQRWTDADRHARWLLEESPAAPGHKVEPWQQDWARIVRAQVLLHTNHDDQGRHLLETVRDTATSTSARAAAEEMLK
jgi:hypothetical protein